MLSFWQVSQLAFLGPACWWTVFWLPTLLGTVFGTGKEQIPVPEALVVGFAVEWLLYSILLFLLSSFRHGHAIIKA